MAKGIPLGIAMLLAAGGATALVILVTRKAKAAPPEEIPEIPPAEIPTPEDITAARNLAELNAWYNLIGELFIRGQISHDEYMLLYHAYEERWYELTGVS